MKIICFYLPLFLLGNLFFISCGTHPKHSFSPSEVTAAPDYSQDRYWAALPWMEDAADLTPEGLSNQQGTAKADVFFIHPTTYVGKRGEKLWNGPVRDTKVNERTQESTIQFQASIFNAVARVFAPYYRQAHLHVYHTEDTLSAKRALDLAYNDVRQAFQHYLKTHNRGRPIIIASHSQGTTHSIRLLQEFFDDKELSKQLVTAYIVGMSVQKSDFDQLVPCQDSIDIGCYTAWRTYQKGVEPKQNNLDEVVTNPLLWTTDESLAPAELNKGSVLRPFERIRPAATNAQVHGPILWASRPKFPGSWLLGKDYHIGDFNLYYMNVRENVALRTDVYLDLNEQ